MSGLGVEVLLLQESLCSWKTFLDTIFNGSATWWSDKYVIFRGFVTCRYGKAVVTDMNTKRQKSGKRFAEHDHFGRKKLNSTRWSWKSLERKLSIWFYYFGLLFAINVFHGWKVNSTFICCMVSLPHWQLFIPGTSGFLSLAVPHCGAWKWRKSSWSFINYLVKDLEVFLLIYGSKARAAHTE